ncbi:transcription antitermination factor NusB [Patescibacteria group bacterium]|nr:transcription antitermination factor NusB [Patescibacteria group bacterium]MBU1931727.1 transcription antitermination factor NusB [Patescibacteria group bacterium]
MKTQKDPRHKQRKQIVKALFAHSFARQSKLNAKTKAIIAQLKKIDQLINICAPTWPIKKINKLDLAVLRLAVFELIFEKKQPPKVIIDEAIELAKTFGSEKTPAFINGVLGAVIKKEKVKI